jgi:hypothetical protein
MNAHPASTEMGWGSAPFPSAPSPKANNHSGHERSAQLRAFYKLGNGLYIGGGAQWSQTSTTTYSKQAWRPTLGVGKDFLRSTCSLRLQGMYTLSI